MKLNEAKQLLEDNGFTVEWNNEFHNYSDLLKYIKTKIKNADVFISKISNDIALEQDNNIFNIKYEPNTGKYILYKPGNKIRFNTVFESYDLNEILIYLKRKYWF